MALTDTPAASTITTPLPAPVPAAIVPCGHDDVDPARHHLSLVIDQTGSVHGTDVIHPIYLGGRNLTSHTGTICTHSMDFSRVQFQVVAYTGEAHVILMEQLTDEQNATFRALLFRALPLTMSTVSMCQLLSSPSSERRYREMNHTPTFLTSFAPTTRMMAGEHEMAVFASPLDVVRIFSNSSRGGQFVHALYMGGGWYVQLECDSLYAMRFETLLRMWVTHEAPDLKRFGTIKDFSDFAMVQLVTRQPRCWKCFASSNTAVLQSKCSTCEVAIYCSIKCQMAHADFHGLQCAPITDPQRSSKWITDFERGFGLDAQHARTRRERQQFFMIAISLGFKHKHIHNKRYLLPIDIPMVSYYFTAQHNTNMFTMPQRELHIRRNQRILKMSWEEKKMYCQLHAFFARDDIRSSVTTYGMLIHKPARRMEWGDFERHLERRIVPIQPKDLTCFPRFILKRTPGRSAFEPVYHIVPLHDYYAKTPSLYPIPTLSPTPPPSPVLVPQPGPSEVNDTSTTTEVLHPRRYNSKMI